MRVSVSILLVCWNKIQTPTQQNTRENCWVLMGKRWLLKQDHSLENIRLQLQIKYTAKNNHKCSYIIQWDWHLISKMHASKGKQRLVLCCWCDTCIDNPNAQWVYLKHLIFFLWNFKASIQTGSWLFPTGSLHLYSNTIAVQIACIQDGEVSSLLDFKLAKNLVVSTTIIFQVRTLLGVENS